MMLADKKQQVIRKSNDLIEARYRLSIAEQRLVLLLAAEIEQEDSDFKDYELKVNEFTKMFGLESDKSIYEKVEQAADNLLGKVITLQEGKDVEKTVWLSYVKYTKGSGTVVIRFDKSLKRYLLQLQGHFTQYNIKHVIGFKSQYSIRLYELLKMEVFKAKHGKVVKVFELKDLRDFLGVEKKEYTAFDNFKRRVINPAVKEISTQTDLNILNVENIRTGRKINRIIFTVQVLPEQQVREKQQALLEEDSEKSGVESHPIIASLVAFGFSLDIAKAYKNKYGVRQIERNIAYTLAKQQEGIVKDLPAYLNKAIKDDMGGAWEVTQAKADQDRTEKQARTAQNEQQAELAHLKRMAKMAGVPLETLLPKPA